MYPFTFETKKNEEKEWLRKVYHESLGKIHFSFPFEDHYKSHNSALSNFSRVKFIVRKNAPSLLHSINEVENLYKAKSRNKISDKNYALGLLRIGHRHGLNNELMHKLRSFSVERFPKADRAQSAFLNARNPILGRY